MTLIMIKRLNKTTSITLLSVSHRKNCMECDADIKIFTLWN